MMDNQSVIASIAAAKLAALGLQIVTAIQMRDVDAYQVAFRKLSSFAADIGNGADLCGKATQLQENADSALAGQALIDFSASIAAISDSSATILSAAALAKDGAANLLLPKVADASAKALTLVQSLKSVATDLQGADLATLTDAADKLETIYTTLSSLFDSATQSS